MRKETSRRLRLQREADAKAARSPAYLRAPISCIMGHVDTGECTFLLLLEVLFMIAILYMLILCTILYIHCSYSVFEVIFIILYILMLMFAWFVCFAVL